MNEIYARLHALTSLKDEVMGDLEDLIDDVETKSEQKLIDIPEQFDEVVDIVVSDSRAKATEKAKKHLQQEEAKQSRPQTPTKGEEEMPQ